MTPASRAPIAILVFVLVFGSSAALAEETEPDPEKKTKAEEDQIHVCLDRNGEVVYQSYPCDERPERPERPAKPTAPDEAKRAAAPKHAAAPTAPERATVPRGGPARTEARRAPAQPKAGVAQRRSPSWQLVGRPSADRPSSTANLAKAEVDPRFASPERTWQTFSAAMRGADRSGARACLTSNALRDLGPLIDTSAPERLTELVGQPARVHVEGDVGPFWSLRISRGRERPKWVFLVRTEGGEWKIAEI